MLHTSVYSVLRLVYPTLSLSQCSVIMLIHVVLVDDDDAVGHRYGETLDEDFQNCLDSPRTEVRWVLLTPMK